MRSWHGAGLGGVGGVGLGMGLGMGMGAGMGAGMGSGMGAAPLPCSPWHRRADLPPACTSSPAPGAVGLWKQPPGLPRAPAISRINNKYYKGRN